MQYNFAEYKKEAITTLKDHTSKEIALCDWTLGLVGEAGELLELLLVKEINKMEFAKEASDVLWYAAALFHELGQEPPEGLFDAFLPMEVSPKNVQAGYPRVLYAVNLLVMHATKVAEMTKHRIMHKEKFTVDQILQQVQQVIICINEALDTIGIDVMDAAKLNVAKLAHRHNGAYSHATSAIRHESEAAFSDTDIYKELEARICGNSTRI